MNERGDGDADLARRDVLFFCGGVFDACSSNMREESEQAIWRQFCYLRS